ncbi:hypothetical protein B0H15DRAFT_825632 [Mycena belliarum]|uniref:MYND-type domain-containing protein n=1 Tax=Mycena belliarum TaxID=1033014 RepID=A0AAD6XVT8_9AGAR|nr:hypothetical protein B0H15DRAFT_825632 [Mycena belliae]
MAQQPTSIETTLGIPSFRDGIEKWNAAWEAYFPRISYLLGDLDYLLGDLQDCGPFPKDGASRDDRLSVTRRLRRQLSTMQKELRALATTCVFRPDFCWQKLAPSARKAHILEGLLCTCLADPIVMPPTRMRTSDITLASMEANNGAGFLTLLRRYVPNNDVKMCDGDCVSYPYPEWKEDELEEIRQAGFEEEIRCRIFSRDDFLSSFLLHTIHSILGFPRPSEISVKSYGKIGVTAAFDEAQKALKPINSKKKGSELQSAAPVYRLGSLCESCEQEEQPGTRFSVCKNCKDVMSRKIYYCSRECQLYDWPAHKKICGKELAVDTVHETSEASLADAVFLLRRIGPALNGYQRSPALLLQIQILDVTPSREYCLFSSLGPQPIAIPHFIPRLVFRLACQTAMSTGDAECIVAICEGMLSLDPATYESCAAQISAEYRVDAFALFK